MPVSTDQPASLVVETLDALKLRLKEAASTRFWCKTPTLPLVVSSLEAKPTRGRVSDAA
jgi:hypothetical protein